MMTKIRKGVATYIRDIRQLSPNARKYLLGSFFIGMTYAAFMLLLNLYLREKGFGEAFIGSVLSAGAIGMTLVSIPGAILISRIRLKPLLFFSTLMYVLFGMVTVFSEKTWLIWLAYLVAGMMVSFYRIASAPFFMRNSTPVERPYLFSLSFGIGVIAGVAGSVIFGNLVGYLKEAMGTDPVQAYRVALTVGMGFSLVALIPFGMLKMPKSFPPEDRLQFNMEIFRTYRGLFLKLTAPYAIVGIGAGMIIPFLNLFFRDRFGQSPEQIGYYFGLVNLTMFIGVMAGPVLMRRVGMVRTIVFTQLASIPFMLILAFSYNFPLVFMAFLARGALMNLGQPIGKNFAMEMVPASFHALVNALLMFAWTSSWMISAQVGGIIIESYGYTVSLVAAVILYVISSIVYFLAFRKSEEFTPEGIMVRSEYRTTGEAI